AFLGAAGAAKADVAPIVAAYGDVFPTLTEQNLAVNRDASAGPWFVTFNLLTQADVKLGALELTSSSSFNLTSIRIVAIDGTTVCFGTDTFPKNPFPDPIQQLCATNALPPGLYALAVSGSGDTCDFFGCSLPDFMVRLQVTPSPGGSP